MGHDFRRILRVFPKIYDMNAKKKKKKKKKGCVNLLPQQYDDPYLFAQVSGYNFLLLLLQE